MRGARRIHHELEKVERRIARLERHRDRFTSHISKVESSSGTPDAFHTGKLQRLSKKLNQLEAKLDKLLVEQSELQKLLE